MRSPASSPTYPDEVEYARESKSSSVSAEAAGGRRRFVGAEGVLAGGRRRLVGALVMGAAAAAAGLLSSSAAAAAESPTCVRVCVCVCVCASVCARDTMCGGDGV